MAYDTDDEVAAGSTVNFDLTASKDGTVWNLTGATVYLVLLDGKGNIRYAVEATIQSAVAGTARYTGLTSTLNRVGEWARTWRVVQGAIDITYPVSRVFNVVASPRVP